ncbi:MAG: AmmeMemoRadiSam system protein B [Anaerolineales bacterium]
MDVRPSPIAGRWYPAQPDALRASVDAFLAAAAAPAGPAVAGGDVIGLLAPHAGHLYSGAVAAHAFRAVQGAQVDVVALICPSHYHDDGPVLTSGHAAYATPLGAVVVDQEAVARLRALLAQALNLAPERALVAIRDDQEHAIEIELPFLQRSLAPGFKLLPVMLRDQDPALAEALGAALAAGLRGRKALLVASSDLSHFYPQAQAVELDSEMLRRVAAFDPAGVLEAVESGAGLACGSGAIAAVMWAARALGANRAEVLKQATSGDVSGDYGQVVGYAAARLWKN